MAFRRANNNPYPFANQPQAPQQPQQPQPPSPVDDPPPQTRKRQRTADDIADSSQSQSSVAPEFQHENGSDASGDSDDNGGKPDKKAGRRKIKIEFIQDKSRRHITFSKRKAGIMKKAYELSTLTGTQVLLLVVSETGLVYTFTTQKLQPLVTQPEGKNLIQACLNAPGSSLPPVPINGPLGRTTMSTSGGLGAGPGPIGRSNVPGGLAISGGDKDDGDSHQADDDHRDDDRQAPLSTRRPSTAGESNAGQSDNKSPTQQHRKPSSPLVPPLPQHYPYAGLNSVGLDPSSMYGHHSQYMPPNAGGAYGPGPTGPGGPWQGQTGQTGYTRR